MIERIYVDNFRCLVNCEVKLDHAALLLGENGSGKSTLFDALATLQMFIAGPALVQRLFGPHDLTAWDTRKQQKFEIDVRAGTALYKYALLVEHPDDTPCRAVKETLTVDDAPLREFDNGKIYCYDDNGDDVYDGNIPALYHSSVLFDVGTGTPKKLTTFLDSISQLVLARPCPMIMESSSGGRDPQLTRNASNFCSWYWWASEQAFWCRDDLIGELRQTIEGFDSIELVGPKDGPRIMHVKLNCGRLAEPSTFSFEQLSDGQRQLIFLYTLLYGIDSPSRTLFLDEPDNFLSLREIQPWLSSLTDKVGRGVGQAIVISHHPEIIDSLAHDRGIWFSREEGGPTRIERRSFTNDEPLSPSELLARGW